MRGTASRTAWSVARRRAAHQMLDQPLVFDDPLAVCVVGGDWEPDPAEPSSFSSAFRAFMAARSRYSEDHLAASYLRGVRQFVVLGAGLDTFAYRNPWPDLQVFEVDHPATQDWKRERLAKAGIALPAGLTFVAVDFETQDLGERLRESGLVQSAAFFSWLGVTPYLTRSAFDSTIRFIASVRGSGVAFDYSILRSMMNPMQRAVVDALGARVARAGEPFRLFFDPEELTGYLRSAGFSQIEDLSSGDIDARYFAGRSDGLGTRGASARLLSAHLW